MFCASLHFLVSYAILVVHLCTMFVYLCPLLLLASVEVQSRRFFMVQYAYSVPKPVN